MSRPKYWVRSLHIGSCSKCGHEDHDIPILPSANAVGLLTEPPDNVLFI